MAAMPYICLPFPDAIPISTNTVITAAIIIAVLALRGEESLYIKYMIQPRGKKKKQRHPKPADNLSGAS